MANAMKKDWKTDAELEKFVRDLQQSNEQLQRDLDRAEDAYRRLQVSVVNAVAILKGASS